MYVVNVLNLNNNKKFEKVFWSNKLKNEFVRKCNYSNKVKILDILDYSHLYD